VAFRLAEKGFKIVGLDLSEAMLAQFEERLRKNPNVAENVTLVRGNMADFDFGRSFKLITSPCRAFQCLPTDELVDGYLKCVHKHLAEDGIFIINAFNPSQFGIDIGKRKTPVTRIDRETGAKINSVNLDKRLDHINQRSYTLTEYTVTHLDGTTDRAEEIHNLRYYYYEQLRSLLEDAGFEITEEYSTYDKKPIPGGDIIFVCRKVV
jgi:SAM-dependent methyltransferase